MFKKLRGKKPSLVSSVVYNLMVRARINPEACIEISEMVYEDLELHPTSDEIAQKCELIISLYKIIDSLARHFGEVHLEFRQDDYAVVRVIPHESFFK